MEPIEEQKSSTSSNPDDHKSKLDVNKWFVPKAIAEKEAKLQQTTYFNLEAIIIEGYKL